MPCARVPTISYICAAAAAGSTANRRPRAQFDRAAQSAWQVYRPFVPNYSIPQSPNHLQNHPITQSPNYPITQFPCGTLAPITIRPPKTVGVRDISREILIVVPLVMRAVAAELRASGELPAPAHFGLLSMLSAQPTSTDAHGTGGPSGRQPPDDVQLHHRAGRSGAGSSERAARTAGRSSSRSPRPAARRSTASVRVAERHLAEALAPLDKRSRQQVHQGLDRAPAGVWQGFRAETRRPNGRPNPRPRLTVYI